VAIPSDAPVQRQRGHPRASSDRSIHAILSGACSAAVRWGWIGVNPMRLLG